MTKGHQRAQAIVSRFQGAIWGASGLPLALFATLSGGFEIRSAAVMPVIAAALIVFGGWMIRVWPVLSKVCLTASSGIVFYLALPLLLKAPPSFLTAGALWVWVVFGLWTLDCGVTGKMDSSTPLDWLERSNGWLGSVTGAFLLLGLLQEGEQAIPLWILGLSSPVLFFWGVRARPVFSGRALGVTYDLVCLLPGGVLFSGKLIRAGYWFSRLRALF